MTPLPPIKRQRFVSKIVEINNLTPTVKEFHLSIPPEFTFYAGQFITLRFKIKETKGNETKEQTLGRSYSIASAPKKLKTSKSPTHTLELCIKLVEDGLVTPKLFSHPPEEINVVGPMGKFFLSNEDKKKEIVFIATGTGIAPFKSMIEDLLPEHKLPITLLTGVRHENEVLYPTLWENYEKAHPNFKHQSIVSRPQQPEYTAKKKPVGRVTDLLPQYINPLNQAREQLFIICGLTPMIDSVSDILLANGVSQENIRFEKYD